MSKTSEKVEYMTIGGRVFEVRDIGPAPISEKKPAPETSKPKLPESWEDMNMVEGHRIDHEHDIIHSINPESKRVFESTDYSQAAEAFAQLSQIYERWKEIEFPEWEDDWVFEIDCWTPVVGKGVLRPSHCGGMVSHFPFPHDILCQKFIDCPAIAELLKTFYMVKQ